MGLVDRECCRPCAGAQHALLSIGEHSRPVNVWPGVTRSSTSLPHDLILKLDGHDVSLNGLEALTRWDAQIWLTLQAKWNLWRALRARGRRPRVKTLPRLTAEAAS